MEKQVAVSYQGFMGMSGSVTGKSKQNFMGEGGACFATMGRQFSIIFYFNEASEKYNRQPIFLRIYKVLPSGRKQCIKERECTLSRSMAIGFDLDAD